MNGRVALAMRYAGALYLGVMAAIGGIEYAQRQDFVSTSSTELLATILVFLAGVAGVAALSEIDECNKVTAELARFRERSERLEDIVRGLSRAKKLPPEYAKEWDRIGPLVQIHRL